MVRLGIVRNVLKKGIKMKFGKAGRPCKLTDKQKIQVKLDFIRLLKKYNKSFSTAEIIGKKYNISSRGIYRILKNVFVKRCSTCNRIMYK